ncbi:MAG: amidase [Pseudomonadota bacterium]
MSEERAAIEAAGVRLREQLGVLSRPLAIPTTDPLDPSAASQVRPRGAAHPSSMPTLAAMRRALEAGETTPRALLERCLERIDRFSHLSAFLRVLAPSARAAADRAGEELSRGFCRGPLHGLPFAIKDAFDTEGMVTTVGSQLFADRVPKKDAVLVARLRDAGAVMVGKLDTTEMCLGGPSHDGGFGPADNPWRPMTYAGASTSGGGAAIAAGLVPLAFGSDTGGSIRLPAAMTGTTGFKPTHDALPREGLYPLAPSLDTAGPLALTVDDCARAFTAFCPQAPVPPALTVGVPTGHGTDCPGVSPEAAGALLVAAEALKAAGIDVQPVAFPGAQTFSAVFCALMMPQAHAHHAERLAREGARMSSHTRVRLSIGAFVPDTARAAAQGAREALQVAWHEATATAPVLMTVGGLGEAPLQADVSPFAFLDAPLVYCPANIVGAPSIVLPVAVSASGMPLAVQLSARPGEESVLLATAARLEAHFGGPPPRPEGYGDP